MADQQTAEALFTRHHRDIHRYLARMTGSQDAADDLAQEVFLRVVRVMQAGGPVGHERGWVFSIAHNLLVDGHRRLTRSVQVADDQPVEGKKDGTQSLTFALTESLRQLSPLDREVFLLKEVGGLSYDEIAGLCECSVDAVRGRLRRTRTTLRNMLSIRF